MLPTTLSYLDYQITTDKQLMQPNVVHEYLSTKTYWAKFVPYDTVLTSFNNSFCIGALFDGQQIAYARLVTDYSTFAYLADVYVEEAHRGKGISKKMMDILMDIDWVKNLRRIMLASLDAKELYRKYGFTEPKYPDRLMEITRPNIYGDMNNPCQ
jgi:GNAT superfamily N-acetyltransferase